MVMHINYLNGLGVVLTLCILLGCANSDESDKETAPENSGTVSGTIDFDGSVTLANISYLTITLEDTSIADAPSEVISETTIESPDEIPIRFSINYDETLIVENRTYTIRAEVFELNENGGGERAYLTTQSYPVLTRGYGNEVNVLVSRIN
jgi:putative lipoprotein